MGGGQRRGLPWFYRSLVAFLWCELTNILAMLMLLIRFSSGPLTIGLLLALLKVGFDQQLKVQQAVEQRKVDLVGRV